jgi:hypothetical protein
VERFRGRQLERVARAATESADRCAQRRVRRYRLDFLGDAVVLTVGGDYRFESGWRFDVAVSEDIAVESASDVVFVFGLRRSWE